MIGGWTGTVLRVNLTRGTIKKEPLREDWARDYVGGRGLGTRYAWEEIDPTVDPFSPKNKLLFVTGPLTGTNASCGARYMVVTKGALTGAITTSNSGGHWGPELKFAGYDMLIVDGRATQPCYLWIHNDEVELRDATHLWGKGVWETEETLRKETGVPDTIVASIGPAGENLVRFAAILNDLHRAAGRSGVGAVMGSKLLKAIAVRGTGGVRLADPRGFMAASWAMKAKLKESAVTAEGLPVYGTAVLVNVINEHGAMPTRNHLETVFEKAEDMSGETLTDTRLVANKACFACTIACGRVTMLPGEASNKFSVSTSPRNWKIAGEGPEYENAWAMGADCGIGDLDALIKAGWLCNDLGMDPITYGATLAAAMEMYEKEIISNSVTGMPLRFGSAEALLAMAEQTAQRRGFGNLLAEGSKRLTARFGHPEFFMGVRGQEFPAYDARAVQGMGLGYATSNRGACHLKAYTVSPEILGIPKKMDPHTHEGKAEITKIFQDITCAVDATGLCLFLTFGVGLEEMLPQLVAATGTPYTMETLTQVGERIWNLERLWNERAGLGKGSDVLPKRLLEEPVPSGPAKGLVSKLPQMLPEYYQLRGWTPEGEVTAEKRHELGLP
ncbi:MAG TPA: aldehyde ferredoxin oxidoreductase family protein [Candidatus Margulisiibacteriota bacterium]|nr:aldehyde ferredoxin oxidoreductase family protein [Candidatus Margulisiibacteriota bacterium]